MTYSECLPTRLNPLAERTCLSRCCTAPDGAAGLSLACRVAGGVAVFTLSHPSAEVRTAP